VVGLDIRTPEPQTIEVGETLQLTAEALDQNGNPVAATITWSAPDPTLTVDQTGAITGVSPGTGRVQAFEGSLASSVVSFNVIARADTLIVTDSIFTVASGVSVSPPLVATVRSFSPDDPLPSWPVTYSIVSPLDQTVVLPGGGLEATGTTGTDGAVSSVTLIRTNDSQPATAIVEVRASRTRGAVVPGSGQRFTVHYQ